MNIPGYVEKAIRILQEADHQAFVVGGCVRDSIMGRMAEDWDLCTSASPEELASAFGAFKTYDVGIKHGTLGVVIDGRKLEITTYRVDGEYGDNRHPDRVAFTSSLEEDLGRRDFTMNAIAYEASAGIVDPFGGMKDIKAGIIKAVGNPEVRFQEDSLRIMRGLRFASVLGFAIDGGTERAMSKNALLLKNVSSERVLSEFSKLILGKDWIRVLENHGQVLETVIPEIAGVTARLDKDLMESAPQDLAIRLVLAFDREVGAVVRGLPFPKEIQRKIMVLAEDRWQQPKKLSLAELRYLVGRAGMDMAASVIEYRRVKGFENQRMAEESLLEKIRMEGLCCTAAELAVSGDDLMKAGVPEGREVGQALQWLLDKVMEGEIENQKEALIERLKVEMT